jgi:hypothetical protein
MIAVEATLARVSRGAALVACVWFAFAAVWGSAQIPGAGHIDGGSAATTLLAFPIVHWHSVYPSTDIFGTSPPLPTTYYCHHPFGVHYLAALALFLFGNRDFVVHLPTVLMSMAIPPLLFSIAKKHWGVPAGAAAACGYVAVPIAVGFANYQNLETMCIFGTLLFFWGLSYQRMAASLAGVVFVCFGDWVGYLLIAPVLGWVFLRAFVLPAWWTPRFNFAWHARWWAACVVIATGTAVLWIGLFYKADKIADWLGSAEMRGGGQASPLRAALEARKDWIDFSFTPLAISLGKVMAPLCLIRAVVLRRDSEFYALSVLFGALVQYTVFKRGADVHIFWPHYFAAYFALALGQLTATIAFVAQRAAQRSLPREAARWGGWLALGLGLAAPIAMAPDAVRSLSLWRRTGGKYDDHGSPFRSEIDILYVVKSIITPRTPAGAWIDQHPTMPLSWEHHWAGMRNAHQSAQPAVMSSDAAHHPVWYARPSDLGTDEQVSIAAAAHVEAYGDAWVVNQGVGPGPIDAWRVRKREPNPFEWLVYGGWEPVRSIDPAPDPLLTWEWRVHFGQAAAPPVAQPTDSLDDLRILQNAAVFRGEAANATELRRRIVTQLDHTVTADFDQGIRLLGVRVTRGVRPCVEAWFQASGPTAGRAAFTVRSVVEAPASFSLIPANKTERDMGVLPPEISTKIWRSGFLYRIEIVLNHRIGRERYWGYWVPLDGAPAPRRIDGLAATVLTTVP